MKKRGRELKLLALGILALGMFSTGAISAYAAGGDEKGGLYVPPPPPGSAFVRFINGDSDAQAATFIRGKKYNASTLGSIGKYYAVPPPGDASLGLGSATINASLKSGEHYSALLHKGKLTLTQEPDNEDKFKTQIVLINVSNEKDVSLKTADGKTSIVDPVQSDALDARAVNPLKIGFSVYAGDQKIADIPEHPLERRAAYAAVVYDGTDGKAHATFDVADGPFR